MIRQLSHIIGTPILSHDEGHPLGQVEDIIIHPDTGRVEGLWVKPFTLPMRHAVLPSEGIVAWKKNLYVKDEGAFADPEEIIRISEILARKIRFVGNRVKSESGKRFGRVFDVDFDDRKMYLRYLFVQKTFLFFGWSSRYFHYDSIVQVTPEWIVVRDEEGKAVKEASLVDGRQPVLDA